MTLQLLHSEFPYIWGKFYFIFYQCGGSFLLTNKIHTIHYTDTYTVIHSEWGTEGAIYSKVSVRSKDLRFLHLNEMVKEVAHVHTVYSEHSPASRRFCPCLDIIPNLKSNRLGILLKRYISCIIINFASGLFSQDINSLIKNLNETRSRKTNQ